MPRYFFHIKDGQEFIDETGTELPGIAEARAQAIQTAGAMMRTSHSERWHGGEWRLQVTDEAGNTALRLRFSAEGIDAIGGGLAAQVEPAYRQRPSNEEARLMGAFRAILDDDVRETILGLIENIAHDGDMPAHVRLV